jgi:hypothetical protein
MLFRNNKEQNHHVRQKQTKAQTQKQKDLRRPLSASYQNPRRNETPDRERRDKKDDKGVYVNMPLSKIYKGIKRLRSPTKAKKCKRLFIAEICIVICSNTCAVFLTVTEIIYGFGWLETAGIIMATISIIGAMIDSYENYIDWKIFEDMEETR